MLEAGNGIDKKAAALSAKAQKKYLTQFSTNMAEEWFANWSRLDKYLLIKYVDGNVKSENADVLSYVIEGKTSHEHFLDNGNGKKIPGKIKQPGYSETWKRAVAADSRSRILEVR